MKTFLSLILLTFSLILLAQDRPRIVIDVQSEQKPWNNLDINNAPSRFQFAIVTDRTGGHRPGIFLKGIQKLNLLQPEFVMSVGDLIEGYTEDTDRLDTEWTEFNGFIDSLQAPFFYVPGNHDITNKVMEDKWKELYGVTYYHFVYGDVLFLCLNSEDNYRGAGRGTIDDEQYEYIKSVLEKNQDVKWTLVFMHQPLWVQEDTKRWADVEALLQDRNHNVFAGHYHRYWKTVRNNGKYIALATTGGGSQLRGTTYGEFDHVVWVTMTDEGPILANLLLDGIWDENVVTEDIVDLVRSRPYPVKIEPIYLEDTKSKGLNVEVKITNDSDFKMSTSLKGIVHESLFYQLDETEIEVEPNDVKKIALKIENPGGNDIAGIDPIYIESEVKYSYKDRPDIVLKNTLNFVPNARLGIKKTSKKVKIDGDLKEWSGEWTKISESNRSGSPFHYSGEEDCSINFSRSYDGEAVYFAFKIRDDETYVTEKGPMWEQDAIIVGLDARPQSVSAMNSGGGRGSDWIAYLQTFKNENPVYLADRMPEGTESAFKQTKDGIDLEIKFPIEYLNNQQDGSWKTFRLGILYYDYDKGGEERTEFFWFPSWATDDNLPGSGMIFRE